jgi:ribonuclease-3
MLMQVFPDAPEGELAPRFNALVRRETLAEVAGEIGLGEHLRLGRSENVSGGRRKAAILADAMEATIAALYLDGGLDTAQKFISAHWSKRVNEVRAAPVDAKTALQEWAQARGMAPPCYEMLSRSGPDHAPEFLISASIQTGETAEGRARSKKLAEQAAAQLLLTKVTTND